MYPKHLHAEQNMHTYTCLYIHIHIYIYTDVRVAETCVHMLKIGRGSRDKEKTKSEREQKREGEREGERREEKNSFLASSKRSLLLSSTASKGVGPHGDTNFGLPPD